MESYIVTAIISISIGVIFVLAVAIMWLLFVYGKRQNEIHEEMRSDLEEKSNSHGSR